MHDSSKPCLNYIWTYCHCTSKSAAVQKRPCRCAIVLRQRLITYINSPPHISNRSSFARLDLTYIFFYFVAIYMVDGYALWKWHSKGVFVNCPGFHVTVAPQSPLNATSHGSQTMKFIDKCTVVLVLTAKNTPKHLIFVRWSLQTLMTSWDGNVSRNTSPMCG